MTSILLQLASIGKFYGISQPGECHATGMDGMDWHGSNLFRKNATLLGTTPHRVQVTGKDRSGYRGASMAAACGRYAPY